MMNFPIYGEKNMFQTTNQLKIKKLLGESRGKTHGILWENSHSKVIFSIFFNVLVWKEEVTMFWDTQLGRNSWKMFDSKWWGLLRD